MNIHSRPRWESTLPGNILEPWLSDPRVPDVTAASILLLRNMRVRNAKEFQRIISFMRRELDEDFALGSFASDLFTPSGSWTVLSYAEQREFQHNVGQLKTIVCEHGCRCIVCGLDKE